MRQRLMWGLAGLILGATVGIAANAVLADRDGAEASLNFEKYKTSVLTAGTYGRGIVVAGKVGQHSVDVYFSLEGLGSSGRYAVIGSQRPCSQVVDAADYVVWRADGNGDSHVDGHDFAFRRVGRRAPLDSQVSVRVYQHVGPDVWELRNCGPVVTTG